MGALWQRKTRGWSWIDVFVFVAWVLLVGGLTLTPQPSRIHPPPSLCLLCGEPDWGELVANMLLFVPAGIIFARRGVAVLVGIAIGFALSATIECAQLWVPGRHASLRDVAINSAGVAVGALLHLRWGRGVWRRSRVILAAALAVPCAMVMYTGWLYSPIEGQDTQYSISVPDQPRRPSWNAEVIDVTVGGQPMTAGTFRETGATRDARYGGDPIAMRFVPTSPASYPAMYLGLTDLTHGDILHVNVTGKHILVARFVRGRGERPSAVNTYFMNFLTKLGRSDTMTLLVHAPPRGPICARLSVRDAVLAHDSFRSVRAECASQPSLASGWRFVVRQDWTSSSFERACDGLVFALSLLPIGLLSMWRGRWAPAGFVLATSAAAAVVGHLMGLAWMGLPEVIALLGMASLGTLLSRFHSSPPTR